MSEPTRVQCMLHVVRLPLPGAFYRGWAAGVTPWGRRRGPELPRPRPSCACCQARPRSTCEKEWESKTQYTHGKYSNINHVLVLRSRCNAVLTLDPSVDFMGFIKCEKYYWIFEGQNVQSLQEPELLHDQLLQTTAYKTFTKQFAWEPLDLPTTHLIEHYHLSSLFPKTIHLINIPPDAFELFYSPEHQQSLHSLKPSAPKDTKQSTAHNQMCVCVCETCQTRPRRLICIFCSASGGQWSVEPRLENRNRLKLSFHPHTHLKTRFKTSDMADVMKVTLWPLCRPSTHKEEAEHLFTTSFIKGCA